MSSKEHKTPNEQVSDELNQEQALHTEAENEAADVVDPRDARIAELENQVKEAQQRERDSLLRAKAEVENIRRRTELDIEKAHKFALEKFSNELLPVIDNLERALDLADKSNTELVCLIEGVELTLKSLLDAVRKFGMEVVSDIHVPFNPELHQAMTLMESEDLAPNHVMMVMQKGYTLNGRLLRPAMVAVSKAKA